MKGRQKKTQEKTHGHKEGMVILGTTGVVARQ